MQGFLKDTAEDLLVKYPDLKEVTVILPNRRAGLFFTKYLGQLISQPMWMPAVRTIEDLFYDLAGQRPTDQLSLIFELYKIYKELQPDPEPFDRFYYWGEMILKDFNDIDQFLVDHRKLYSLLSDIKSIESDLSFLTNSQVELIKQFWKSFEREGRGHQDKFLRFWQLLTSLYDRFQEELNVLGYAYSGKLYRKVAEQLDKLERPSKQFVFVGFNAFTGTEEKLVKHFTAKFGAKIYWDLDAYYTKSPQQEAGLFFRDYQKDKILGPTFPKELPENISTKPAKIKVYVTPLKVNQANLIGTILDEVLPGEHLEETVVILPEEQLLFPVMHQLPSHIDRVNVTMGYPVRNAPVYAFLESLLDLQRYVKVENSKVYFYHQVVKDLLSSTYLKIGNEVFVKQFLERIQKQNQIYISQEDLAAGGAFYALVFQRLVPEQLFDYLESLMISLANQLKEDTLQGSYLYQCHKQLVRLKEIFQSQTEIDFNLEFFIRLFRQIFKEVRLPFEGEPLAGLQVMGVLESRNLDFKRVIIANMNEGSFPPSSALNSLVPFNLRRAFGLPVQEQNDAIYAYTFYRLLHRAEEVHMVYATAADQGKVGEKSRYIQQMMAEMPIEIEEEVVFVPVDLQQPKEISIAKTPAISALLEKYVVQEDGKSLTAFSPSAFSVWLDCKLKFYFQYLANIKEKEKVEEEVSASVFGNLAHYSLEFLYKGFMERKQRRVVEKGDFDQLSKYIFPSIEKAIRDFYHLEVGADTKLTGQMAIVRDVLQKYITALLDLDKAGAPFELVSLEKDVRYQAEVPVEVSGRKYEIAIRGIIDRVDKQDGVVRLIDYKSGKDQKDFPSVTSLFDRDDPKRNKAAMQTLIYGMLYQEKFPENSLPLKPAIYNLKEIFSNDFNPYLQLKEGRGKVEEIDDYRNYQEEFEQGLKGLLQEIFDDEVPFGQTEDWEKCKYCPYNKICGR
ncbi:PD-(D/E)XK nuclease family protein [Echinicola marina]|uniref:PD-(D/E)XK nuclease family protein n=1 Tax=Echinicola marina TaxID=2859768 RepID=UPI001CF607F5|nr:PD-(D/E)XK nuclease family protein [Echinicola marina]UCS93176.1 PD-(D/E)XK nuclease family protein [Echinicola marina]